MEHISKYLEHFKPPRQWVPSPEHSHVHGVLINEPFEVMRYPYCKVCGLSVTGHCMKCASDDLHYHLTRAHPNEAMQEIKNFAQALFGDAVLGKTESTEPDDYRPGMYL